jgi:CheY-like chemotaxis protein
MESENARRPRVLIADDNLRVVKSVSRLLAVDYDVVGTVQSDTGVLEAAEKHQPDIIILDFHLRGCESVEICRQLTQRHPALKVIMFSADDDPEVRDRALEAGAADFVDKLFADALLSALERLHTNIG